MAPGHRSVKHAPGGKKPRWACESVQPVASPPPWSAMRLCPLSPSQQWYGPDMAPTRKRAPEEFRRGKRERSLREYGVPRSQGVVPNPISQIQGLGEGKRASSPLGGPPQLCRPVCLNSPTNSVLQARASQGAMAAARTWQRVWVKVATWLILPVVICLSQRLSHACLSISKIYSETANGSLNQLSFI
jgi:hypothetical protein